MALVNVRVLVIRVHSEYLYRLRDLAIIVLKTGFGVFDINNNWRVSCLFHVVSISEQ